MSRPLSLARFAPAVIASLKEGRFRSLLISGAVCSLIGLGLAKAAL